MRSPFRTLHHICIVVHDLDRAVGYYESIGIGPWQDYPPLTEFAALDVPDREAFLALRYKLVNLDNVQLQLCQPPELDCAQRRFLDRHGEGVFHIGFENDLDAAAGEAAAVGLRPMMSGRRPNGTGFVYYDTLGDAGVVLMNRQTTPAGRPHGAAPG
jgi:methylmalonyl-CoA/ethylmalonyl-CoA epimerase